MKKFLRQLKKKLIFLPAYFIIFQSFDANSEDLDEEDADNAIIPDGPIESFIIMFIVSLGNFGDFVGGLPGTNHSFIGKVVQLPPKLNPNLKKKSRKQIFYFIFPL